jgi:hypothetical protein
LFGESEPSFFETWANGIILGFLLLIGLWLLSGFFYSKTGKKADNLLQKAIYPLSRWYRNLSHNLRMVVGWLSLAVYCLGIVAVFIWIES